MNDVLLLLAELDQGLLQRLSAMAAVERLDAAQFSALNDPEHTAWQVVIAAADSDDIAAQLARQAHTRAPDASLCLIVPEAEHHAISLRLAMTPQIGHYRLHSGDPAQLESVICGMLRRGQQKRKHRATLSRIDGRLAEQGTPNPQAGHVLDSLLEHAPLAVLELDGAARMCNFNKAANSLFSPARPLALGQFFSDRVQTLDRGALRRLLSQARGNSERQECLLRLDVTPRCTVSAIASPLSVNGSKDGRLLMLQNVSARVQAETELREANAALEERVLERTAELAERNAELQRSNSSLDEFAYIASHDLKEPLRAMGTFAGMLQEDLADTLGKDQRYMLKSLSRLAERMDGQIESLLTYARLGREDLTLVKLNMNKLLAELKEEFRMVNPELELIIADKLPDTRCDPGRITSVLRNLISNGIKYNKSDKPQIKISVETIKGEQAWAIRDNGIGIAPNHHERIFQVFKRLHKQDDHGGGHGVGLTFSRRIVHRHGGELWLESTPGEGSCFYFTLPQDEEATNTEQ